MSELSPIFPDYIGPRTEYISGTRIPVIDMCVDWRFNDSFSNLKWVCRMDLAPSQSIQHLILESSSWQYLMAWRGGLVPTTFLLLPFKYWVCFLYHHTPTLSKCCFNLLFDIGQVLSKHESIYLLYSPYGNLLMEV